MSIAASAVLVCAFGVSHAMSAQAPALEVEPLVGTWQHTRDGGDRIVLFDGGASQPAIPDGVFPVAAVRSVSRFSAGTVEVRFKLVGGKTDQTAGIVFNLKPNGDYHYVRFNTKDGNVALWKYSGGRSVLEHGAVHRQLPPGEWHQLRVHVAGTRITGEVVGTPLRVEKTLDQPVDGRIGFWTKADSVTAFKDLRVTPLR